MRTQDLKDFAINTARFYQQHCDMASQVARIRVWEMHIIAHVLPAYRTETREPYEGLSLDEISRVAIELQHYYSKHVAEL